jgi:hypothetical protein
LEENVQLVKDEQSNTGQDRLGELDLVHEIERFDTVHAHELVLVSAGAAVKAERNEQKQQTKQLTTGAACVIIVHRTLSFRRPAAHKHGHAQNNQDDVQVLAQRVFLYI